MSERWRDSILIQKKTSKKYKEIKLTRGFFAKVSCEDYDDLSQFKWMVRIDKRRKKPSYYARRAFYKNGKQYIEYMHRRILGLPLYSLDKRVADHINGNGLDNRRINLRVLTHLENTNHRVHDRRKSKWGFYGLSKVKDKFYCSFVFYKKLYKFGPFNNPIEAALKYDDELIKIRRGRKNCLRLNFKEVN